MSQKMILYTQSCCLLCFKERRRSEVFPLYLTQLDALESYWLHRVIFFKIVKEPIRDLLTCLKTKISQPIYSKMFGNVHFLSLYTKELFPMLKYESRVLKTAQFQACLFNHLCLIQNRIQELSRILIKQAQTHYRNTTAFTDSNKMLHIPCQFFFPRISFKECFIKPQDCSVWFMVGSYLNLINHDQNFGIISPMKSLKLYQRTAKQNVLSDHSCDTR